MNTTEMINRLPPPSAGHPWSATASTYASEFASPTARERFDEILPLLDVVPGAGPPMLFVLGPWLFVVLMLIGPFVLLFTLVLAAMIFVAVAGGMCVLPYLLVRHLRKPWSLSSAVPPPDRRSRAMSTHPHKPMSHRTECD